MSFGAPGGRSVNIKPTPPERGSFPLDHDGECKFLIASYLNCLKTSGGVNDDTCRKLAKGYLGCRMDKNLMAPDDFRNLGLVFEEDRNKDAKPKDGGAAVAPAAAANDNSSATTTTTKQ